MHNLLASRLSRELCRCPIRHNLPIVDDEDAGAGSRNLRQNMRAEKHQLLLPDILNQIADFNDLTRVKSGRRFIQDHDRRIVDKALR